MTKHLSRLDSNYCDHGSKLKHIGRLRKSAFSSLRKGKERETEEDLEAS